MAGPKTMPRAPKGARHHAPTRAAGTSLPSTWGAAGGARGDLPEPKSREKLPALADTQLPGRLCFWLWQHPDGAGGGEQRSPLLRQEQGVSGTSPAPHLLPAAAPHHLPPQASPPPPRGWSPAPSPLSPWGSRGRDATTSGCKDPAAPDPSPVPRSMEGRPALVWLPGPGAHVRDEPSPGCGCSGGLS